MQKLDQKYKNINETLEAHLEQVIIPNVTKVIVPGVDYIPVTGKVLDAEDLLYGVDA
ncbi:CDP-6-deoxy-D-xylo-4-hexulose-3-dehydrase, partial [Hymenobacter arizonensis]